MAEWNQLNSKVSGTVEQHGLNLGLIRRLVGNDLMLNIIIRKGRNLERVT
jgi:hypothetical protein